MSILNDATIQLIKKNDSDFFKSQTANTETYFNDVKKVYQYLSSLTLVAKQVADLKEIDANLRLAIIKDLYEKYQVKPPKDNTDKSITGKIKLALLALIGTAYHICNGFAGGASILSLFLGVPGWAIMAFGLFLSMIYVVLFLYIDLANISDNLNVKFFKSRRMIDIYLQEKEYLQLLITHLKFKLSDLNATLDELAINEKLNSDEAIIEAEELVISLQTLLNEQKNLVKLTEVYMAELERKYIKILKLIFPLFTDALFFSYGFFTGEAMIPIISAAFHTYLSITSWPGIILCIFAGFAALSLYWLNDRLNVENLIGIWVGLDIQKIQLLPKTTNIEGETKDIESYGQHVKLIRHIFNEKMTADESIQGSSTYLSTGHTLANQA